VTRLRATETFGPAEAPFASLLECRLETGRTHQIRVHAAHIGHPLVGDPVYGRARTLPEKQVDPALAAAIRGFPRQALHAANLGFRHPVTGEILNFCTEFPADMRDLVAILRRNSVY
jgi:23S rRNA pseudouridine1911/1915/1917 synthase